MDEYYSAPERGRPTGAHVAIALIVLAYVLVPVGLVLWVVRPEGYLAGNLILVGGLSMFFGITLYQFGEKLRIRRRRR